MTLSIWRYAHFSLAIISFIFLSMASITGSILAFNTIREDASPYRIHDLNQRNLAQTLPVLQKKYLEITELEITENSYIKLQGLDEDGNDVEGYINPENGKIIGIHAKKSEFIQWVTSFHRSLFLHETGRIIVGINSFLLALIAISGSILILKRQKKLTRFFSKIKKNSSAQYYHAIFGRILLIPIIIISITGTYLSMERFNLFHGKTHKTINKLSTQNEEPVKKNIKDIPLFKQITLSEVQKIEFPFSEEPDDYYTIKLKDKEIIVNQFNGAIISQTDFPLSQRLANTSLDLHTGRTSTVWAVILIISSSYILFFIYSGFSITGKRKISRSKNKYAPSESNIVLLVGSENGSTFRLANNIHQQLLAQNQHSHLAELNKYQSFPKLEYLLIFTSTYGLGNAPTNAKKFETLVKKYSQDHPVNYCVIGFGSRSYKDFCGFAETVDKKIKTELWSKQLMELYRVNDASMEEFVEWVKEWNNKTSIKLFSDTKFYKNTPQGFKKMKIVEVYAPEDSENTFILKLKPGKITYTSGDILVIYIPKEGKERYYSIGKINNTIQLSIKYFPSGLASEYLINSTPGDYLSARVMKNTSFHFPEKAHQVALIANGTGIGPFLGMIEQNVKKTKTYLYCGFRRETKIVKTYKDFLERQIKNNQLEKYNFSFSSGSENRYVMDLIKRDKEFFVELLANGGIIMICGALKMQTNVEEILEKVIFEKYQKSLIDYEKNGQIVSDCY